MKIFRATSVVLWAVGICLALPQVAAAGAYDGSGPLICVPLAVTECGSDGECQKGTPQSVNLPQFFRVDFKAMTIRAVEENRESAIKTVDHVNGRMILQGVQGQHGWTLIIAEDSGQMAATIAGAMEGYIIFGSCTLLSHAGGQSQ
jgi:hypothetical protein